jgi:hypothetical protein
MSKYSKMMAFGEWFLHHLRSENLIDGEQFAVISEKMCVGGDEAAKQSLFELFENDVKNQKKAGNRRFPCDPSLSTNTIVDGTNKVQGKRGRKKKVQLVSNDEKDELIRNIVEAGKEGTFVGNLRFPYDPSLTRAGGRRGLATASHMNAVAFKQPPATIKLHPTFQKNRSSH